MYSVVLMAAMTSGADLPAWHRTRCHGVSGCYGNRVLVIRHGCFGGARLFGRPAGCHGRVFGGQLSCYGKIGMRPGNKEGTDGPDKKGGSGSADAITKAEEQKFQDYIKDLPDAQKKEKLDMWNKADAGTKKKILAEIDKEDQE